MDIEHLPIEGIEVGERSRKDLGDLTPLMVSMGKRELINPITVDSDHNLIAGERRLRAAESLGWETIPCHVVSTVDELLSLRLEQEENECRLDTTPEEKVRMGQRIEALEKPKGKARQSAAGKTFGKGKDSLGPNDQKLSDSHSTRQIAAEQVGMSEPTYKRAKRVVKLADENPENEELQEIKDKMNAGEITVFNAHERVRGMKYADENPASTPSGKTSNGDKSKRRHPSPVSTQRAIDSIEYAVDAIAKLNIDRLKKTDRQESHDRLFKVRGRISKLIKTLKESQYE